MEEHMNTIIERKANAPLQVKIGSDEYPANDTDISAWQEKLETLKSDTEWATNHVTEIKTIGFEGQVLDLKPYDEHFSKNIQQGLMVPSVLMGDGGSNEGLGTTQMKDFILQAKSIQKEIEKYLEEDIFFELVNQRVDWNWGEFTVDDVYKQLDVFSRVLGNELNPIVRAAIETKILKLLNVYDTIITAKMIEDREKEKMDSMNKMGQPGQPGNGSNDNGANRPKQTNRNPKGTEKRPLSSKGVSKTEILKDDILRNENMKGDMK